MDSTDQPVTSTYDTDREWGQQEFISEPRHLKWFPHARPVTAPDVRPRIQLRLP